MAVAPFDIEGLRHFPKHHIHGGYPILSANIQAIHDWLNQQGVGGGTTIHALKVRMDALRDSIYNPPYTPGDGGCSGTCVLLGTLVDLADGTTKVVESLLPGDVLLDGLGGTATVAGLVEVPLALRPLIRIGGVGITPDHPLLVGGSWQVADLAALAQHRPATIEVNGQTITGDYNATQKAAGPLAGYSTEAWLPSTRMFSPILSTGSSFSAEGLVHAGLQVVTHA